MSKRFPVVIYRDAVKVAKKLGFYFCRYAKGNHEIWRRDSGGRQTTIPNHGKKAIKRRTIKSIFQDFQISASEFIKILKK